MSSGRASAWYLTCGNSCRVAHLVTGAKKVRWLGSDCLKISRNLNRDRARQKRNKSKAYSDHWLLKINCHLPRGQQPPWVAGCLIWDWMSVLLGLIQVSMVQVGSQWRQTATITLVRPGMMQSTKLRTPPIY